MNGFRANLGMARRVVIMALPRAPIVGARRSAVPASGVHKHSRKQLSRIQSVD